MSVNNGLDGQSRSRRKARPYVLALVGLGLLVALIVLFAQPRETREGARSNVVAGEPSVAQAPPVAPATPSGEGRGTAEMPDAQTRTAPAAADG